MKESVKNRLAKLDIQKVYNLDHIMSFGKYKGWTVESVLQEDAQYIQWVINSQNILLSNETYEMMIHNIELQNDNREYRED
jgi:hypothetical protein